MTPTVLLALINSMTPQEVMNSLKSLKEKGAFDNSDLKTLIEEKLDKAKTSKSVSGLKAQEAIKVANLSDDVVKKLEDVADKQMRSKGTIKRPTALLIDKSGSMQVAIELGKRIGAMIAGVCESNLYTYAFDTLAYLIDSSGKDLSSWERALKGINAGGGTSCGVALEWMIRRKEYVEQIILVTDEGENSTPAFAETLIKYRDQMKSDANVCIVRVPGSSSIVETNLKRKNLDVDVWQFSGDYYSLPNLITFLNKPSKLDLLMEIMTTELPKRKVK